MRPVVLTAWGCLASDEELSHFAPRRELPNRKHLKLMTRPVRLGVAAVARALARRPGWESVEPLRRGLFVGTTPSAGDASDLVPALRASTVDGELDLGVFGAKGVGRVHPLWLVKGLSNNVLGFATAYHDLRGANGNRTEGRAGGLGAILDGWRAVAEGRLDLAVAGGADTRLPLSDVGDGAVGEGAAFVVLEAGGPGVRVLDGGVRLTPGPECVGVDLGAASGPVALVRHLGAGETAVRVEVGDALGISAWIEVG